MNNSPDYIDTIWGYDAPYTPHDPEVWTGERHGRRLIVERHPHEAPSVYAEVGLYGAPDFYEVIIGEAPTVERAFALAEAWADAEHALETKAEEATP